MDIVRQYEGLLKLDPASAVFAALAEELCYRGFWEGAVKVCRQGLTHHPQNLRGRVLLGWALKELGETEEAEQVLLEAEAEIHKNALLFRLLAELAKKSGDLERGERFMLIHQNLQPGTIERSLPVELPGGAPAARESEPDALVKAEPEISAAVDEANPQKEAAAFLTSLLDRYEALPAKTAAEQQLFTEADRQTLSRLLKGLRR